MTEPIDTIKEETTRGFSYLTAIGIAVVFLLIQMLSGAFSLVLSADLGLSLGLLLSYIGAILFAMKYISLPSFQWDSEVLTPMAILISIVFLAAVKFATSLPLEFIPGYDTMMEGYMEIFGNLGPITMFFAAIVAPLGEEILFRGMVQKGLQERYGGMKAVIAASAIFALIHMLPIQVMAVFGISIALGWLFYKTGNIWLPIIIHIVNNTVAMIATSTMDMEDATSMRHSVDNDMIVIAVIIGSALIAYVCFRYLDQLWSTNIEQDPVV